MSGQAPGRERDTTAKTPGRIAYEAHFTASGQVPNWGDDVDHHQAWEAAAIAVAAHVVDPTAADYDHAAEIASLTDQRDRCSDTADQLRALVGEILDDFWPDDRFEGVSEGLRAQQARVDDYRERAGLERQR